MAITDGNAENKFSTGQFGENSSDQKMLRHFESQGVLHNVIELRLL